MAHPTTIGAVVLLSLLLAACGGGAPGTGSDPDEAVREVVEAWAGAVAEGDGELACSYMTGNGQRSLVLLGAPCAETVRKLQQFTAEEERKAMRSLDIGEVHVDGDRATVPASSFKAREGYLEPSENPDGITLVRRDGRWLIESLG